MVWFGLVLEKLCGKLCLCVRDGRWIAWMWCSGFFFSGEGGLVET